MSHMSISRRTLLISAAASRLAGQAGNSRKALVFGNKNYAPPHELTNPLNDAADIKKALTGLGFQVTLYADAGRDRMRQAAGDFVKNLSQGDIALYYYSGHGMQLDSRNYLVPVDFAARNQEEAQRQAFNFTDLQDRVHASKAALSILVMDACRNNPYLKSRSWERGLALVEATLGSFVAFAASPGQTASDNIEERNGLFTKHLLAHLAKPVPLTQLFREVRKEVYQASNERQLPFLQDQLLTEFRLAEPASAQTAGPGTASTGSHALLDQARRAEASGNCELAWQLLDRAIRQDPENAQAHNAAGVALTCLGQHSQALPRFNMAIQLKRDYAAAYWNRGRNYLNQGKYDLAMQDFDWAIDQDPLNSAPVTLRAWAALLALDYTGAAAGFSHAVELNDSDALAYQGRGQLAYRQGKYREALEAFQAAKSRKSDLAGLDRNISDARNKLR